MSRTGIVVIIFFIIINPIFICSILKPDIKYWDKKSCPKLNEKISKSEYVIALKRVNSNNCLYLTVSINLLAFNISYKLRSFKNQKNTLIRETIFYTEKKGNDQSLNYGKKMNSLNFTFWKIIEGNKGLKRDYFYIFDNHYNDIKYIRTLEKINGINLYVLAKKNQNDIDNFKLNKHEFSEAVKMFKNFEYKMTNENFYDRTSKIEFQKLTELYKQLTIQYNRLL